MRPAAATLLLVATLALAAPARADDEALDKARLKELLALAEEYGKADENGRTWLEMEARKDTRPLSANLVQPFAEALFAANAKHRPKLKKSGTNYLYDERTKNGLYLVSPGKKGGGLLISLHGGGEGQGDAGGAHSVWGSAKSAGFTVISPEVMTKVSSAWNEQAEERFVLELIEAAKVTFDVDPDRVCIAGHSMGGDGAWMIGGRNADVFAAAAPLAGSVMPYMRPGTLNRIDTPLADYLGLMEGVIPNLMWLPYHIHHSDDDRNEAIHPDDIATGYLRRLQKRWEGRYRFTYDRVSGNGHALPKSGVKPVVDWLAEQRRVTYPREVVWETWWKWKTQMYWLHHEEPRDAWRFHARFEGTDRSNHVEVDATTKLVAGRTEPKELELTLLLSPRLIDFDRPLRVTCRGTTLSEGPVHRDVWSVLVTAGRRNDRAQWFEGRVTVSVPRRAWRDLWDE